MTLPTGPAVVGHGWSLSQVAKAAQVAARHPRAHVGMSSLPDRQQVAWDAIVEALLVAATPPTMRELVSVGIDAVNRYLTGERHHHGLTGDGPMAAFPAYWGRQVTPSPEAGVVERIAISQILPTLAPAQRRTLLALAATGDPAAAASMVGLAPSGLTSTLRTARKRFLALWHEGERPSRVWGVNRPGRRGRKTMHDLLRQRARYRQANR